MEIDIGRVIAGKYQLSRLLGRGAMGEVWLATHKTLDGEFAIKVVNPEMDIEREVASKRFTFEAQVSAKLSRKTRHIVSVVDHGEEDGIAYLVMEKLDGESLESLVDRQGALELPFVVGVLSQIARALAVAHREGVIHRDLKPGNVFLTHDEDGKLLVKLLDFGIARPGTSKGAARLTAKDMVLGTPAYMSPEQAQAENVDARCDVWAMAVLAYEALAGTIPWIGENAEQVFASVCMQRWVRLPERRPDLPPEVAAIFQQEFVPSIDSRFQTAAELAAAFEALAPPSAVENAIAPGAAPRPVPLPRPATEDPVVQSAKMALPIKKSGLGVWIGAGALVAIAALAISVLVLRKGAPPASAGEVVSTPLPPVTSASGTALPTLTPLDPPPAPTETPSARPSARKPTVASPPPPQAPAPPPRTAETPPAPPPAPAPTPARKTDKGEIF